MQAIKRLYKGCYEITGGTWAKAIAKMDKLKECTKLVINSPLFSNKDLDTLKNTFTKLNDLTIKGANKITDAGLSKYLSNNELLRFSLINCENISADQVIKKIGQLPKLGSCIIKSPQAEINFPDSWNCKKLTFLYLEGTQISNLEVLTQSTQLKDLLLQGLTLNPKQIEALSSLKKLDGLFFMECRFNQPNISLFTSLLTKLSSLGEVNFINCQNITEQFVQKIDNFTRKGLDVVYISDDTI